MTTRLAPPHATERRRLKDGELLPQQTRVVSYRADEAPQVDVENRTCELTFSSEYPVDRWYGTEVLSHAPGAADLSRLNDGGNLLWGHDPDDVLGVIERAWIGDDKRGHAIVRFGKDERGTWAMNQVQDRIVRNVSFMYVASDYICETEDPDRYSRDDTYTAQNWVAFEISLLTIAADPTVGVGRSADQGYPTRVHVATRTPAQPPAAAETSTEGNPMKPKHILQNAVETERSAGGGTNTATPPAAPNWEQERKNERERQTAIRKLGERWNNGALADLHIEGGSSVEQARSAFLEAMEKGQQVKPVGARVDMTDAESRSYSLIKAIRAIYNNNWKEAGFEREVSTEIAKQLGKESGQGFFVPTNLPFAPDDEHRRAWAMAAGGSKMQQRAPFAVGATGTGGAMVATQLLSDNWIEVLRNTMVTPKLGARFLSGLVGKVDIPRQITAAATSWVGELTAGTESEATFDKVSLSPKNITSWGVISRLMLLQSTPAIEMIARADLLAQIGLGLDLAALSGSGTGGQPTGIINQAGVGSVVGGTNGLALSFDHLIQLYSAPKIANAPQSNLGFAFNAKAYGYLATLKASTGQYLWDPQGGLSNGNPDTVKGYPYAVSQQLRSNLTKGTSNGICSELIFGNWLELLIAEWGALEIAINPYDSTYFKSGDVVIRAIQTADIGVRHGASFAVMSDALTPGF